MNARRAVASSVLSLVASSFVIACGPTGGPPPGDGEAGVHADGSLEPDAGSAGPAGDGAAAGDGASPATPDATIADAGPDVTPAGDGGVTPPATDGAPEDASGDGANGDGSTSTSADASAEGGAAASDASLGDARASADAESAFDASPADAQASPDGAPASDASSGDARTPADASSSVGCGTTLSIGPTVPVGGYAIFASEKSTYVFDSDDKSWTVISRGAASAVTEPMPLPAGVSSMQVLQVEQVFDGSTLLLFKSASGGLFATFFDGAAFSAPIALPTSSLAVHADAQRHLYAIDASNILWTASGGAFLDRGVVPLQGGPFSSTGTYRSDYWDWAVNPNGDVVTVYTVESFPPGIHEQTFSASSFAWSAPATVVSSTYSTDSFTSMHLAAAPDGSLHTFYAQSYEEGTSGNYGINVLYTRRTASGPWQTPIFVPDPGGPVQIAPFGYGDVEMLLSSPVSDSSGNISNQVWIAQLGCTLEPNPWRTTKVAETPGYDPAGVFPSLAVDTDGYPSILLKPASGESVVTTY
jgi:hypothetical protein